MKRPSDLFLATSWAQLVWLQWPGLSIPLFLLGNGFRRLGIDNFESDMALREIHDWSLTPRASCSRNNMKSTEADNHLGRKEETSQLGVSLRTCSS